MNAGKHARISAKIAYFPFPEPNACTSGGNVMLIAIVLSRQQPRPHVIMPVKKPAQTASSLWIGLYAQTTKCNVLNNAQLAVIPSQL
jgi:hypothetical protein